MIVSFFWSTLLVDPVLDLQLFGIKKAISLMAEETFAAVLSTFYVDIIVYVFQSKLDTKI